MKQTQQGDDPMPTDLTPVAHSTATPAGLMQTFVQCVHADDLDELLALYEPDAVFEPEPGVVCTGTAEIREALAAFLSLRPSMVVQPIQILVAADVALVVNEWTMQGTGPDGSAVSQGGRSADVVRRQPDGSWRVLIDRP
jgi:uncharacterized protein (TIGR02246 family)